MARVWNTLPRGFGVAIPTVDGVSVDGSTFYAVGDNKLISIRNGEGDFGDLDNDVNITGFDEIESKGSKLVCRAGSSIYQSANGGTNFYKATISSFSATGLSSYGSNRYYVAWGGYNKIVYSSNGTSWSARTMPSAIASMGGGWSRVWALLTNGDLYAGASVGSLAKVDSDVATVGNQRFYMVYQKNDGTVLTANMQYPTQTTSQPMDLGTGSTGTLQGFSKSITSYSMFGWFSDGKVGRFTNSGQFIDHGTIDTGGSAIVSMRADGNHYVALDADGVVYVSYNGYSNWVRQPPGLNSSLIKDFDRIVSDGNDILATAEFVTMVSRDLGVTWSQGATFTNANSITTRGGKFVLTSTTYVYVSSDGISWTSTPRPTANLLHKACISSTGRIVVTSNRGEAYISDVNDDTIWTQLPTGLNSGTAASAVSLDSFGNTMVAIWGLGDASVSIDDGVSWSPLPMPATQYSRVSSASEAGIVFIDADGVGYQSSDLGQNWKTLPVYLGTGETNYSMNGLSSFGSSFLYTGTDGLGAYSDDAGISWTSVPQGFGQDTFTTPQHPCVLADGSMLMVTVDGRISKAEADTGFSVLLNGSWGRGDTFVKVNGAWVRGTISVNRNGSWS